MSTTISTDDTLDDYVVEPDGHDDDDAWPTDAHSKGFRVRLPVGLLVLVIVALAGVWGGAKLNARNQPDGLAALSGLAQRAQAAQGGGQGATTPGTGNPRFGGGAGGGGGGAAGGFGGGATIGTVQSVDGNKITLTAQDGSTVTVNLDDQTSISKTDNGSPSDITNGQTLVVRGTTNDDGSTTAQSVSIGVPGGFTAGGATGGRRGGRAQAQGQAQDQTQGQGQPQDQTQGQSQGN